MTYTERDFEIMGSIADGGKQKAKATIAEFLEKRNDDHTTIDDLIDDLHWTNTLDETGRDELRFLLLAIDLLRDELTAWAKEGQ